MRLVLDTSVIVSSVRSETGASRFVVKAALAGRFELLVSVPLVLEYESVLMRPHQMAASRLVAEDVDELLISLLHIGVEVNLDEYRGPSSVDLNDNHVLNLARTGNADAIVTHNVRHFKIPAGLLGVSLYTPGGVLLILED